MCFPLCAIKKAVKIHLYLCGSSVWKPKLKLTCRGESVFTAEKSSPITLPCL